MRGPEFAELTAFVAVAEQRNFTKAAAQLGMAPSTLSQTIRTLETRLGVRLLNRTTRSVAPTNAGEQLLTQLLPALDSVGRAIEAVNAFRDKPMGTLRLSAIRSAALCVIAPLIAPFLAAHPAISLEIVVDDTRNDIVSERFDAGVRIGELIDQDMIAVRLSNEFRMIAVASPDYLARHAAPAAPVDLQAHNCIRIRWAWDGVVHPWEFVRGSESFETAVDGSLIVNEMQLAVLAALDGVGIGYLPDVVVAPHLADGRLVQVLDAWSKPKLGIFLYYSGRRQVPAPLQAFIAFVRGRMNGHARPEQNGAIRFDIPPQAQNRTPAGRISAA